MPKILDPTTFPQSEFHKVTLHFIISNQGTYILGPLSVTSFKYSIIDIIKFILKHLSSANISFLKTAITKFLSELEAEFNILASESTDPLVLLYNQLSTALASISVEISQQLSDSITSILQDIVKYIITNDPILVEYITDILSIFGESSNLTVPVIPTTNQSSLTFGRGRDRRRGRRNDDSDSEDTCNTCKRSPCCCNTCNQCGCCPCCCKEQFVPGSIRILNLPPIDISTLSLSLPNQFFANLSLGSGTSSAALETPTVQVAAPTVTTRGRTPFSLLFQRPQTTTGASSVTTAQLGQIATDSSLLLNGIGTLGLSGVGSLNQQTADIAILNSQSLAGISIPSNPSLPEPQISDYPNYPTYINTVKTALANFRVEAQVVGSSIAAGTFLNTFTDAKLTYFTSIAPLNGKVFTQIEQFAITQYNAALQKAAADKNAAILAGKTLLQATVAYNAAVSAALASVIAALGGPTTIASFEKSPSVVITTRIKDHHFLEPTYSVNSNSSTTQSAKFSLDLRSLRHLIVRAFFNLQGSPIATQLNLRSRLGLTNSTVTTGLSAEAILETIMTWISSYSSLVVNSWTSKSLGFEFKLPTKCYHTLNFIFSKDYLYKAQFTLANATIPPGYTTWVAAVSPIEPWGQLFYGRRFGRRGFEEDCSDEDC